MAQDHLAPKNLILTENVLMHLKSNLKELIKSHGITVVHLARTTNIPLQTLHGWLSGSEPRSMKQIKVLAEYFNITIDEICFGLPNNKKRKEIKQNRFEEFEDEINAGTFEVVLRRIRK